MPISQAALGTRWRFRYERTNEDFGAFASYTHFDIQGEFCVTSLESPESFAEYLSINQYPPGTLAWDKFLRSFSFPDFNALMDPNSTIQAVLRGAAESEQSFNSWMHNILSNAIGIEGQYDGIVTNELLESDGPMFTNLALPRQSFPISGHIRGRAWCEGFLLLLCGSSNEQLDHIGMLPIATRIRRYYDKLFTRQIREIPYNIELHNSALWGHPTYGEVEGLLAFPGKTYNSEGSGAAKITGVIDAGSGRSVTRLDISLECECDAALKGIDIDLKSVCDDAPRKPVRKDLKSVDIKAHKRAIDGKPSDPAELFGWSHLDIGVDVVSGSESSIGNKRVPQLETITNAAPNKFEAGLVCFSIEKIVLRVHVTFHELFLASEIKENSCVWEQVLAHELGHLEIVRTTVDAALASLAARLESSTPSPARPKIIREDELDQVRQRVEGDIKTVVWEWWEQLYADWNHNDVDYDDRDKPMRRAVCPSEFEDVRRAIRSTM